MEQLSPGNPSTAQIARLLALGGRIQWMSFISVMIAVVIIFGSSGIVDYIRDHSATAALEAAAVVAGIV